MELADIKKHTTHLSEEVRLNAAHEEHVTVGGKIINITPPFNKENSTYIVTIDDSIGTLNVLVSEAFMTEFKDLVVQGNYVFFEGFVNIVSRSIKGEVKKDVSVFAYSLKCIPNDECGDQ
ncbi:hypothetical protein B14_200068 (plasmid) [Bacillus licheniformis]|uniref:hypothetical protein n=1 Tax=Bacillus subtilis group TaxID=653685 RepID=UPI0009B75177|nr:MULTISPECIES: hypothetical protein [Bacillus subtilis group]ARC67279.1 hypothetical protein B14_200068 [Bacillus licheniformis]ARW46080.1 hypothetical protein S100141_04860 [Bacillus licheniformis]MCY1628349.1 hypothetical protein [Bacillus paralicheniformis]MDE1421934.1 hypothetical protein [Bacillus licheniformis]MEC0475939.1 hypothetical protein [Bacillus licheniformis]